MLLSLGYSEKDIAEAVRASNRIKHLRRQTVSNMGSQKMEEAVESAKKQVKRILFFNQGKKEKK